MDKKSSRFNYKILSSSFKYIVVVLSVISVIFIVCVISDAIKKTKDFFNEKVGESAGNVKEDVGKKIEDRYERKYHVSNRITIGIGNISANQKLEVLRVSDVEFIIVEGGNNDNNITSWLEIPGDGVYTVDLKGAEYIVDEENSYVLVRVPNPELDHVSIDYENVKKLLFKNDILNDSYSVGAELAKEMLDQGDLLIRKEFSSNQNYYKNAQDSAVSSIQYIVKQFNRDVEDLVVDVEFY